MISNSYQTDEEDAQYLMIFGDKNILILLNL